MSGHWEFVDIILVLSLVVLMGATMHDASSNSRAYRAQMVRCHDGDTCTFDINLGFGNVVRHDIRFCDIDTPEMHKEAGPAVAARDWVVQKLSGAKSVVLLVPLKARCQDDNRCEKSTFGRYLAWVMVDGEVINGEMLTKGIAVPAEKTCGTP